MQNHAHSIKMHAMAKKIEDRPEYIGYGKMAAWANKIHLLIFRFGLIFKKMARRFAFQQFKMQFGERDDDVYIVSFPKSGTTLMQMMLYQMTTDGRMDFEHIYEVSPWIRNASLKKEPVPQLPSPRIIKSHDDYDFFKSRPKGRFIFVYRNGMDTAISYYHQQRNYNNPDELLDDHIKKFFKLSAKGWFRFCQAWFKNKKNFPILYIRYENLLNDKMTEIRKIADFLNLTLNDETIQRTLERSSFDFMKKHESKFGEQPPEKKKKVYDQFIRSGKTGEGKAQFSPEQEKEFNNLYEKSVKRWEEEAFG